MNVYFFYAEIQDDEINMFLHLTQKFKMAAKNGGKAIFGKSRQRFLENHQQTLLIP